MNINKNAITIFSRTDCRQCKMVKKFLSQNDLPFIEINLDKARDSDQFVEFLKEEGYRSLPVVFYKGDSFSGFSPDKLRELKNKFH